MKKNLRIYYDEEGDFFELFIGESRPGYHEEIQEGIFQRRDDKTDEVIGISITNFKRRTKKFKEISITLPHHLEITP